MDKRFEIINLLSYSRLLLSIKKEIEQQVTQIGLSAQSMSSIKYVATAQCYSNKILGDARWDRVEKFPVFTRSRDQSCRIAVTGYLSSISQWVAHFHIEVIDKSYRYLKLKISLIYRKSTAWLA